jgi:hypothetical protein
MKIRTYVITHTMSATLCSFEGQLSWSLTGLPLIGLNIGVVAENIVSKRGRGMENAGFSAKVMEREGGGMEVAEPDRARPLEARAEEAE